jgi:hypothetical protein
MTPGGVAYELQIPLGVFERLPKEGADVELRVVAGGARGRRRALRLHRRAERDIFGKLLSASGVGPRLALSVMSTCRRSGSSAPSSTGRRYAPPHTRPRRQEGRAAGTGAGGPPRRCRRRSRRRARARPRLRRGREGPRRAGLSQRRCRRRRPARHRRPGRPRAGGPDQGVTGRHPEVARAAVPARVSTGAGVAGAGPDAAASATPPQRRSAWISSSFDIRLRPSMSRSFAMLYSSSRVRSS